MKQIIIAMNFFALYRAVNRSFPRNTHTYTPKYTHTHTFTPRGAPKGGMVGTVLSSFLFTKIILGDGFSSIFFSWGLSTQPSVECILPFNLRNGIFHRVHLVVVEMFYFMFVMVDRYTQIHYRDVLCRYITT